MLPADLNGAEAEVLSSLHSALAADAAGRWTVELRFEGLRLLPVALRLTTRLIEEGADPRLLFADAGAAALARRDGEALAPRIASFSDHRRRQGEPGDEGRLLLLVAASQAEYEEVEALCDAQRGPVVLLNPSLEDTAVGIGSVARQRRKGFLSTWSTAYALIPQMDRAIRRRYPQDWELYRLDPDGFRLAECFPSRPDAEQQAVALGTPARSGLGEGLQMVDELLEGLRH